MPFDKLLLSLLLVFISNVVVDTGRYNVLGQFYWEIKE